MTGGRRFTPRSPDWGQDHLSLDAIVAYVDGELATGAHARAEAHLACCADCSAEVVAQLQARAALRTAAGPRLPSSLLHTLRSIPVDAELPPPPPGLGITADGQFVLLRDVPRTAEGPADPDGPPHRDGAGATGWLSRRARLGAVSGLAVGALAVGALAVPSPTTPLTPAQAVFGGAVFTVPAQAVPSQVVPTQARTSAGRAVPVVPAAVGRSGPAVVDTPTGGPATGGPATRNATAADDGTGNRTTADDGTAGATPDDPSGVLDARLRTRLDRSPVAFYHNP